MPRYTLLTFACATIAALAGLILAPSIKTADNAPRAVPVAHANRALVSWVLVDPEPTPPAHRAPPTGHSSLAACQQEALARMPGARSLCLSTTSRIWLVPTTPTGDAL